MEGEDEHYKVETILQSCLSPNRRSIQYLVKWKGYPDSENSWLSATAMKHAQELVHAFHASHPHAARPTSLKALQAQQEHKEGILLRSVTTKENPPISHVHKGEHPIGKRPIRFYTPGAHAQHPVAVRVSTNQKNGIHQISPYMDKRASIKGAGEGAQTHRVLLGKRIDPTPYLER